MALSLDLQKKADQLGIQILEKNNHGEKTYMTERKQKNMFGKEGYGNLWGILSGEKNKFNSLYEAEKSVEKYIIGNTTTVVKTY